MIEFNTLIFIFLLLLISLSNNAIHALLSLILIFINFAILLFYLNNIFLGFSYILVYIGAICVLFLYIILVLHVRIFNVINKTNLFFLLILLSFSFIYIGASYLHIPSYVGNSFTVFTTDITLLASYLFVTHTTYLLFSMVLLLVALIITLFLSSNEINVISILSTDLPLKTYNKYKLVPIVIPLVIILGSVYVFNSPILLIVFMILCSLLQISSGFTLLHNKIKFIFKIFIIFLLKTRLLSLNFFVYRFFHYNLNLCQFKIISLFIALLCFLHLVLCRYIFYLRIEHVDVPFYLIFLFIIGFFVFFLRSWMTFSFFIIPYTFNNFIDIGNLLLTDPEIPEIQSTSNSIRFGGMFNKHSHHHYYPPEIPKSFFHRNVGIGLAVTGVGLTCYACYQYKLSADAAIRSAEAAIRSADVAEVSAGLMTKEEYNAKWKKR